MGYFLGQHNPSNYFALTVHISLPPFPENLIATPLWGMAMYKNRHEKSRLILIFISENQSAM